MLLAWGLQGIEIFYNYRDSLAELSPELEREANNLLLKYSRRNNLLITGGTDFHGEVGKVGDISIPEEIINNIITFFA